MAMLPARAAEAEGFELAATLLPARAVGGDLYDHLVSGGRLYFMVGDVSGKGMPAALFMARTKTLFELAATRFDDPEQILVAVNRVLAAENDAGMFVTVCCGILDLASGGLRLALGGHDAPILVPADGPAHQLQLEGGPLLGLMEDVRSPANQMTLRPGDLLVAYSDGVSEAMDRDDTQLSIPRVVSALEGRRPAGAAAARDLVLDTVRAHAEGAEQSDDITILAIRRPPSRAATKAP
jgi:sigma-B regulation protein RsbU (phosphoserine phosphatase)